MIGRRTYDVVVVGLGIMGAATLFHLGRRGVKALGIEARGPLHAMGSSHGDTRIFRRSYWEGERYVPLLNRSYEGWMELGEAGGETVAARTGGLFLGHASSTLVRRSRDTAASCHIAHEFLGAAEIARRFPAFHVTDDMEGVYEPDALMLFADPARLTFLSRAVEAGAELSYGSGVRSITRQGQNLEVAGDDWQVSCGAVVLTVGGWVGRFLPDEIGRVVTPMRIPVYWFDVAASAEPQHLPGAFPVFLFEDGAGALVYGFPKWRDIGGGLKIGYHNRQLSPVDPDSPRRPPDDDERLELWRTISALLPGVRSTGRGISCVYTMSRDESFLIGRSREIEGVVFASACSGHGFKFAPGIGEALAQLVIDGRPAVDLTAFDAARFDQRRAAAAVSIA